MDQREDQGEVRERTPAYESADAMGGAPADRFGLPEEGDGRAPRGARRVAHDFGERVENRLNWGFGAAAGRLEDTALRIDRFADGGTARAGTLAHSLADLMEASADFLRNSDVESLRGDLRGQMRERPLQTLAIGVVAGWVIGKILR